MHSTPSAKYSPLQPVFLPDRKWPDRVIERAPIWCSVDLRDGNQALAQPMDVDEKLGFFDLLAKIGFKEIEIGFPSASQIEFDFCRRLIDEGRIPPDVTIQILCQCREELVARSCEALKGARNVLFHLYNSTSPAQRQYVFEAERADIVKIATRGTKWVKEYTEPLTSTGTNVRFQYSPESFTSTELDFALEICEAVTDVWQPTVEDKIIINLPATVEYTTPNVHADQIEWMCRHLTRRDRTMISLHTHNDRGTGIAATELGLLAGAERVEGTLFGNGERTGNVDIVTVALNMYTQGVHPGLDFSDINRIRAVTEKCTRLEVPIRHPYAGELVFTAFSGSHQDAINKGMTAQDVAPGALWQVPYLPIDPTDIGRSYEAIIRINSQSGKGGVAYVMETEFGYQLPKAMHIELGRIIKNIADECGEELSGRQIFRAFEQEYLERSEPFALESFHVEERAQKDSSKAVACTARVSVDGIVRELPGHGNGPIDAFVQALNQGDVADFKVLSYTEHALEEGAEARAIAYIQIQIPSGTTFFGAATDTNIELAAVKAVISALNRSQQ